MLCPKPINLGTLLPCGQCMACRINKQRVWASRIQLEALSYANSVFITLTYDEDHVSYTEDMRPTLVKKDLKAFFINLSNNYPRFPKFRYFGVGEYGEETARPHYHAILFGVGLDAEPIINKVWGKGFTSIAEINGARCSYVAQYNLKKMTKGNDDRLFGRQPEFTKMSLGIGRSAVPWLVNSLRSEKGQWYMMQYWDVYNCVRLDGKIWPLGRYMRMKIREQLGIPNDVEERITWFQRLGDIPEIQSKCPTRYLVPKWELEKDEFHPHRVLKKLNTQATRRDDFEEKKSKIPEAKARIDKKGRSAVRNIQTRNI